MSDLETPNLQNLYMKYGTAGIVELARRIEKPKSYLISIIYGARKKPSLDMALIMEKQSGGVVTADGLNNPEELMKISDRFPPLPDPLD